MASTAHTFILRSRMAHCAVCGKLFFDLLVTPIDIYSMGTEHG